MDKLIELKYPDAVSKKKRINDEEFASMGGQ
jgi:hypothetical protein